MLIVSAAHPFLIEGSGVFEHMGGHSETGTYASQEVELRYLKFKGCALAA